jgi:hypothetical protein
MTLNKQMGNDIPENNLTIIQLVLLNDEDWEKIESGDYVHIKGILFHAIWGHHHTRVLLRAKKIQILSN